MKEGELHLLAIWRERNLAILVFKDLKCGNRMEKAVKSDQDCEKVIWIKKLGLASLEIRRQREDMIQYYKAFGSNLPGLEYTVVLSFMALQR